MYYNHTFHVQFGSNGDVESSAFSLRCCELGCSWMVPLVSFKIYAIKLECWFKLCLTKLYSNGIMSTRRISGRRRLMTWWFTITRSVQVQVGRVSGDTVVVSIQRVQQLEKSYTFTFLYVYISRKCLIEITVLETVPWKTVSKFANISSFQPEGKDILIP